MKHDSKNSATDAKPTHEQIAIRAELLWKAQGSPAGRDEQIWLEAERQLFDEAREIIAPSQSGEQRDASPSRPSPASAAAEQMSVKASSGSASKRRTSSNK